MAPTIPVEQVAAAIHEPPAAPVATDFSRKSRPNIVGPDSPEPPFPIALSGPVQRGFGRGGKDLGCPTGLFYSVPLIYVSTPPLQQTSLMIQYVP